MHLMVRSHVRRRRKIKLVNKSVNKCTCIQFSVENFRQNKKKSIRLKGRYIKYKKKSPPHNFYANYKEYQFLGFTLNTRTHQFHNKFASGHQLVYQT